MFALEPKKKTLERKIRNKVERFIIIKMYNSYTNL